MTIITVFEDEVEEEEELVEIEKIEIELEKVEVDIEPVETEPLEETPIEIVEEPLEEPMEDSLDELLELMPDMPSEDMGSIATIGLMASSTSLGSSGSIVASRGSMKSRTRAAGLKNIRTINDALKYLASRQNPEGTWGGSHINATSGACALAFLGNGNSTEIGPYKENVQRFVNYYLDNEPKDSGHGNHGHATPFVIMAMCDAYVMDSKNKKLGDYCKRAIDYVCKTQLENGGWSGGSRAADLNAKEVDIAQSAWYVMSLVSAKFAGISVPKNNLSQARELFLSLAHGKFDGKILVTSHGGQDDHFDRQYSLSTYVSTVLIFLGVPTSSPVIQEHAKIVIDQMQKSGQRNYWQLYNQGLGLFQMGNSNPHWQAFKKGVLAPLRTEASLTTAGLKWDNSKIFHDKKGKSDTDATTKYWGDNGATAMAVLNLQVFYRYGSLEDAF